MLVWVVCKLADLLSLGRKQAKPGAVSSFHFEVFGKVTNHNTHTQDDERLPHPAMKEKELRKAFKPDTKKPPTGRMLLLQCFTVLRMQ